MPAANPQTSNSPIGVIGLGAMGRGMAASLRRAGYRVHVCDVRAEVAQAFAAEGGVACATPRRFRSIGCPNRRVSNVTISKGR